jgi:hypothetical protein
MSTTDERINYFRNKLINFKLRRNERGSREYSMTKNQYDSSVRSLENNISRLEKRSEMAAKD